MGSEKVQKIITVLVLLAFIILILMIPERVMAAPEITLDDELQIYLEERCAEYEVDYFIMLSLVFSESSFRMVDGDGGKSKGLCQVRNCWWDVMAERGLDVNEPRDNLEIGLIIFKENLDKADGDYEKAIQYYKCGAKRGKRLWKQGKKLSSIQGILDRAEEWRNQ